MARERYTVDPQKMVPKKPLKIRITGWYTSRRERILRASKVLGVIVLTLGLGKCSLHCVSYDVAYDHRDIVYLRMDNTGALQECVITRADKYVEQDIGGCDAETEGGFRYPGGDIGGIGPAWRKYDPTDQSSGCGTTADVVLERLRIDEKDCLRLYEPYKK